MVESTGSLVKALSASRLLTAPQRAELVQDLQRRFPGTKELARALLERAWLTPYQVNQLLQGNGTSLELGPYVILERLGDNVLGEVFKARHHYMNRPVTLTLVREELLAQPQAVEQFYYEIQAASQFSDPHLVHAYDAGPSGRTHFFAMEFVDGTDLERLVEKLGRLSVNAACSFVLQIAQGLQHAYVRGLLHHDLRPGNILIGRVPGSSTSMTIAAKTPVPSVELLKDGVVKIANLGLTLLQPRPRHAPTGAAAAGERSRDYTAPEQVQEGRVVDIRSNLYSLGCIFYFMLAGRPPFAGGNSSLKRKQHELDEPPALDSFRSDVSPQVAELIRTLLAKRPEDRYQDPTQLSASLNAALAASAAVALPSPDQLAVPPDSVPARRRDLDGFWTGRRLGLLAGAGVGLIGLIWLAGALLSPAGGEETAPRRGGGSDAVATFLPRYVRKASKEETILATLKANGFPTFEGKWYFIGPFDNTGKKGFAFAYPPEKEIDLKRSCTGKDNASISWKELPGFQLGQVIDFKKAKVMSKDWSVIYLYHEVEVAEPVALEVALGSDDTLTVWLNGQKLLSKDVYRTVAPDQDSVRLDLKAGKNQFLVKVCQGESDFGFYFNPRWPDSLTKQFGGSLRRDFPERPTAK